MKHRSECRSKVSCKEIRGAVFQMATSFAAAVRAVCHPLLLARLLLALPACIAPLASVTSDLSFLCISGRDIRPTVQMPDDFYIFFKYIFNQQLQSQSDVRLEEQNLVCVRRSGLHLGYLPPIAHRRETGGVSVCISWRNIRGGWEFASYPAAPLTIRCSLSVCLSV